MFLIAILFTALGTAIASKLNDMQAFPLIMNFLIMPLFFLSGALFPLNGLPAGIEVIARINPLSYGVDGIRYALTGITHFGVASDLIVVSISLIIAVLTGTYLFSKIQV